MDVQRLKPIRFGEYLLERAAISEGQLLDSLAEHWARRPRLRIGETIAARGYLASDEVERLAGEFAALQTIYV